MMTQTATKLEPAKKMLSFDNVELYYDHVYALKGVSIDLMEGETVALIGANGAGKSSILRAITGLRKIKSGTISYLGDRIDGRPAAEIVKRGIAMVPEGRRVFPLMSVKDNLLMGAFTRTDKQGIEATLDSVLTRFPRLKERFSQQANTLSGGEQQMMVIGARIDGEAEAPAAGRTLARDRAEAGAGHRPRHRGDQPG
jgi:branched-chain amino acid transport system ATP-binding protein